MSNKSVEQLYNERAFEIYQRRVGAGTPGDSHTDWVQAKKEVDAELSKKAKAPEVKPAAAPKAEVKVAPAAPKAEVRPAVAPKAPEVKAVAPKAEVKPAAAPVPVKKVSAAPVKKTVAKR